MMQEALCVLTPVTAGVVLEEAPSLRIARTVLPDIRADFNETFQHIRLEYDRFYKQQVPIFNNSVVAELHTDDAQIEAQDFVPQAQQHISCDLNAQTKTLNTSPIVDPVAVKVVLPEEWEMHRISRTVLPEQRPDFNETFQHLRLESDRFYQQQVAIFDNLLTTEDLAEEQAATEQDQAPEQVCTLAAVHEINTTGGVQKLVNLFLSVEAAKAKARTELAASIARLKKAQVKKASGNALPYSQLDLRQPNQYSINHEQQPAIISTATAGLPPDAEPVFAISLRPGSDASVIPKRRVPIATYNCSLSRFT